MTMLVLAAAGCGDDGAGDSGDPVKIRMGWGVPGEEIKYVMMRHPEVARNLGKAYDIEWHQFAGTPLGVQGWPPGRSTARRSAASRWPTASTGERTS